MMQDPAFKNGTMVMKDGTVKTKDGSTHLRRPSGDAAKGQLVLCHTTVDLFGDHWLVGCECVEW
jgi:hypothetical protein